MTAHRFRPWVPAGRLSAAFLMGAASLALAQGTGFVEPRLGVGGDRHGVDLQLGARFGYETRRESRIPVSFFADGDARLLPKPVRVAATETFSYQFHESRWAYGAGVGARAPLGSFSPLVAAGLHYTNAVYWGSNREPASGFVGWLEGGFQWDWNDAAGWGLSWQYRPVPETSPGRLLLRFVFRFD